MINRSNIREKWNKKLSLKCNMKRLGLVYDINSDIGPFEKSEKMVCSVIVVIVTNAHVHLYMLGT